MAMNGDVMAAAVIAAIATLTDAEKLEQDKVMKKLCGAIVAHITANAVVTTVVAVTNVTGVTVGAGVSGAGTGTGAGTIA